MIRIYTKEGRDITTCMGNWTMKELMLLKSCKDITPRIDSNSVSFRYIKNYCLKGIKH